MRGIRLLPFGQITRAMSSTAVLPLEPPSVEEEAILFEKRSSEMEAFFRLSRFNAIQRPYSASSVASKQGSMPVVPLPSNLLADKLFSLFTKAAVAGKPVHTMGAIDPIQMTQMARHQEVVYVSGWAASSVLTTGNNEVGPDLGCVMPMYIVRDVKAVTRLSMALQRLSIHHCAKPSSQNLSSTATP
jgi:isocitrate lyase